MVEKSNADKTKPQQAIPPVKGANPSRTEDFKNGKKPMWLASRIRRAGSGQARLRVGTTKPRVVLSIIESKDTKPARAKPVTKREKPK